MSIKLLPIGGFYSDIVLVCRSSHFCRNGYFIDIFGYVTDVASNFLFEFLALSLIARLLSFDKADAFAGDGFSAIAFVLIGWHFVVNVSIFIEATVLFTVFGLIFPAFASALALTPTFILLKVQFASASGSVDVIHDVFVILRMLFGLLVKLLLVVFLEFGMSLCLRLLFENSIAVEYF